MSCENHPIDDLPKCLRTEGPPQVSPMVCYGFKTGLMHSCKNIPVLQTAEGLALKDAEFHPVSIALQDEAAVRKQEVDNPVRQGRFIQLLLQFCDELLQRRRTAWDLTRALLDSHYVCCYLRAETDK